MPTPKRGPRLGGGPSHQRLLMAGLATELFRHGRIRTTEARAKFLRPYAEKLITSAKKGDLAARREVLKKITDRDIVAHLFDEIAPRFAERPGGYTRILKLGPRAGDNAPMALIELVDREVESAEETIEERKRERSRGLFGRRRRKEQRDEVALPDEPYDYDQDADELADDEQFGDDDLSGELDDVSAYEAEAEAEVEAATEDAIDAEASEDPAPEEKQQN